MQINYSAGQLSLGTPGECKSAQLPTNIKQEIFEEWIRKLPRELKGHKHQAGNCEICFWLLWCSLFKKNKLLFFFLCRTTCGLLVFLTRARTQALEAWSLPGKSWCPGVDWFVFFSILFLTFHNHVSWRHYQKKIHLNLINGKCTEIHKWILFSDLNYSH